MPTPATNGPTTLSVMVSRAVYRLRTERGWTQAQLARRLLEGGLSSWTPNAVAQVERGRQRADHLLDLAALCEAFELGLPDLLAAGADPDAPVDTGRAAALPLSTVLAALRGEHSTNLAALGDLDDPGAYHDTDRLARSLGLTPEQFAAVVFDLYGSWLFGVARDKKAGLIFWHAHTDEEATTRGRRGHATRAMLAEMSAHLAKPGNDMKLIWARTRPSWAAEELERRKLARHQLAEHLARVLGHWPTEAEVDEFLAEEEGDTEV